MVGRLKSCLDYGVRLDMKGFWGSIFNAGMEMNKLILFNVTVLVVLLPHCTLLCCWWVPKPQNKFGSHFGTSDPFRGPKLVTSAVDKLPAHFCYLFSVTLNISLKLDRNSKSRYWKGNLWWRYFFSSISTITIVRKQEFLSTNHIYKSL